MSNTEKTAIIVGAGPRSTAYYDHMTKHGIKIIGVADLLESNRKKLQEKYNIPDEMVFSDYLDLFAVEKPLADMVLIATNDREHLEPYKLAVERGYNILLEKPVASFPEDVAEIDMIAENYDKSLMICYVLRYTAFFKKIKEIIDSGKIGKIMSIQHNENMAYWFAVQNFVRGKWNNVDTTSPLLLAKCCHDMDILVFLTGKKCLNLSSFGNLGYFKPENAPEGSGTRCIVDCKIADECPYNVMKFNINPPKNIAKFRAEDYVEDVESLTEDMTTSQWGRCVYRCDNNVCDHQVIAMEFEDNITAVFTVSAFTFEHNRTIKVMGTLGEVSGDMELGEVRLSIFGEDEPSIIHVDNNILQHGGGDEGLIKAMADALNGNTKDNVSDARDCLHSHMMVFAAEESRLNGGKVVNVEEFTNRYKNKVRNK